MKYDGFLSRRQFLKGSLVLAAGGLTVPFPLKAAGSSLKSSLSVFRDPDPFDATVGAVRLLGGMGIFVPRGSRVLIKPNIGWDRRVEQAANTHPEVVRALIELCREAGAARVQILDRTCNDARRCYRTSGIQEMVEKLSDRSVSLDFVNENRFRNVGIPRGLAVREWPLIWEAFEADVIINVPIAKHHSIGGLTLGMKNLMGIMGGNRGKFHWGIGQKLADLTSAIMPPLTVLDASRILVRNGPTGGRLEDVKVLNLVAASADPVAIDAFGTTLFGKVPGDLSSVTAGYKMGLGEMDLSKVRIIEG